MSHRRGGELLSCRQTKYRRRPLPQRIKMAVSVENKSNIVVVPSAAADHIKPLSHSLRLEVMISGQGSTAAWLGFVASSPPPVSFCLGFRVKKRAQGRALFYSGGHRGTAAARRVQLPTEACHGQARSHATTQWSCYLVGCCDKCPSIPVDADSGCEGFPCLETKDVTSSSSSSSWSYRNFVHNPGLPHLQSKTLVDVVAKNK